MSPKHLQDEIRITFTKYAIVPVFIIALICIVLAMFYWNKNVLERNTKSRETAADIISSIVNDYENKVDDVIRRGYDLPELKADRKMQRELYTALYHEVNVTHDNASFYLLDADRNIILSNRTSGLPQYLSIPLKNWGILHRMELTGTSALVEFAHSDRFCEQDLVVGRTIIKNGEIDGYIIFIVPGKYLRQVIFSPYVFFVVADNYNSTPIATTRLFSDDYFQKMQPQARNASGLVTISEQRFYSSEQEILSGRMRIYAFSPIGNMLAQYLTGAGLLFGVLIIMIPVIVFSVRRETRNKMQAIDELVAAFAAVKEGQLDHRIEIQTGNEFEVIGNAYNRMINSLSRLIRLNEEKAKATVISEVRQLESQFNPHFLFNTLENIKFMVRLDPDAAIRMIIDLSALLRYSINNEKQRVTLREDLKYLWHYIEIQQYRFGKRLVYEEEIEEAAKEALLPKLLLQPIIENAMKYGADKDGNIYIRTEIKMEKGRLEAVIIDHGQGIDDDILQRLRNLLTRDENISVHTGVYNIHRRIQLLYGAQYGLELSCLAQGGTKVCLHLPAVFREVKE